MDQLIIPNDGANIEEFTKHLDDLIIKLQNRYQLYILGDMNIVFLKYNNHTQTEEYLDVLLEIIYIPTTLTK